MPAIQPGDHRRTPSEMPPSRDTIVIEPPRLPNLNWKWIAAAGAGVIILARRC